MKAFEFDRRLIDSYARFSRSFSTIRSADLKSEIDRQYDAGRFWPGALLSLNPRYLQGPTVDDAEELMTMAQAVVTEKYRQYEDLAASHPGRFHPDAQLIGKSV
jgi:hypothetical protein